MKKTGVAIFGCGRMGQVHFSHLLNQPDLTILWLVDVADIHPHLRSLLQNHNLTDTCDIASVDEMDKVVSDTRLHAVFVCTPAQTHEKIIKAALTAGKDVFCEKPLAVTSNGILSCCQLARDAEKTLFCGFQRRHDPDFSTVHDKIKNGEIGKPIHIKITSRDAPSHNSPTFIRTSGGMYLDSCIHDFDMACWLSGERPVSIVAFGFGHQQLYQDLGDVDCTTIMLNFPSGLQAVISNSRIGATYGYDQRLEVLGTQGVLTVSNPRINNVELWVETGTTRAITEYNGINRYMEAYKREVIHFLDIVRGKVENKVTYMDLLLPVLLAEKALESLKTGQVIKVFEMPEVGDIGTSSPAVSGKELAEKA